MWLRRVRFFLLTRALKNALGLKRYYSGQARTAPLGGVAGPQTVGAAIREGDRVRVRSRAEILRTLNERNKLEGCFFMQEMFDYCGSEQKVLRKVEHFFDEAAGKMRKARAIFILEGVHCSGNLTGYVTKCDRHCYSFWKEAWLERIDPEGSAAKI